MYNKHIRDNDTMRQEKKKGRGMKSIAIEKK